MARAFRGQALEGRVALGEALADVAELRARAAHVFLGVAQLARERVAPVRVAAHRALQRLDALAHLAQFLLGIGVLGGGRCLHGDDRSEEDGKEIRRATLNVLI